LKDIHFRSTGLEGNTDKPGNITHMYVFGIVALLVLLIACINYMNLATARFAGRSKEIAVRKVSGASRVSLIRMFLAEASFITLLAFIFSLGLAQLLLPWFNKFTEKNLTLGLNTDYRIWLGMLCIIVFAALLSGIYPALFQSKLKPYLLLKSKLSVGKGNFSIRQTLVVIQFSMSIIMIIATIIVYRQMKYVDTADMGFNKEQLVVVDINSRTVRLAAQTIKTEFNRIPGVRSVSITSRVPGEWKAISKTKIRVPGKMTTAGDDVYFLGVDDDFIKAYNMKLLKGRNFSASSPGDSTAIILNEQAAALFGVTEPEEQIIQALTESYQGDVDVLDQPFNARVIGIVKDFNFQSMREKVAPMVLGYQNNPLNAIDYFTVKIETKDVQSVLKGMQAVLHDVDASHLFEYNFLDKQWELFYREDRKRQTIFMGIAILTIVIACLGLLGLATFAAQQRIKEIGIRKVVGASVQSIIAMLSKDFLKLVIIAAFIAEPIAWWSMNNWLRGFAYHVSIGWGVFALAMLIAFSIALITVSTQAIKAAMANPVKSLRTE
jgi:putative ABC transport system permease protein